MDAPLSTSITIVGRPARAYKDTLQLLDDVAKGKVSAEAVLTDTIRILLIVREAQVRRIDEAKEELSRAAKGVLPLSSEAIIGLIEQHLKSKNASRLPVLVVAAAYNAVSDKLQERVLPLKGHVTADKQTGALGDVEVCLIGDNQRCRHAEQQVIANGDVEVCLIGDNQAVTVYEMKSRRVTKDDLDAGLQKLTRAKSRVDNYVFITTDRIDVEVQEYALEMYESTGGTEFAVLDCLGFLRHFLHLFHRRRARFLDHYQDLVLSAPVSDVNQPLKEAFLALHQAALADET
jgi:hypothetical protein